MLIANAEHPQLNIIYLQRCITTVWSTNYAASAAGICTLHIAILDAMFLMVIIRIRHIALAETV